ncbi:hypothetical protein N7481_005652 [Penicillium waksmanii]|uniref:uncharacterized protein n=1 Tax=Penicillium waksmanii TaxID=69791 RepID=UPI002547CEDA|nr:uncharacterized protein N7481_005652 [Penicillium waksmanii]KAJ5983553.1 hypothetical protein N7481_005652 [Penicillium waksmanii]
MATGDCLSGYYYRSDGCYRSDWYIWGRWVVLVAIAVLVFTGIALFTFIARRRRNRGLSPYYGTGWMAPQRQTPQPRNGDNVEMHNPQRRANSETLDNPPPVYDPQRLPQYENTATTTIPNLGQDKPENQQIRP